jgi:hypothetical protein
MDTASDSPCCHERHGGIGTAAAHLKASWAQARNAAQDVEEVFETRPKTIALGALGAGLLLGFAAGWLFRSTRRTSPEVY